MFDYEYWGYNVLHGDVTMALEEYMLKRSAETKKAMIRFYSFPKDTIILGYSQATDVLKHGNINVVRRPTGGSHVQTGPNVLAYSFAAPHNGLGGITDMRRYYSEHIANAFSKLGIEDVNIDLGASSLNVGDNVVAGQAIAWGRESGLLHGLLVVKPYDLEKLASRIALGTRVIGGKVYSDYDAIRNMPTMIELLPKLANGAKDKTEALKEILCQAILNEVTKGKYKQMQVTYKTVQEAYPLAEKRYAQRFWTTTHNPVFTPEEIEEIPGEELNGELKKGLGYCFYIQVDDTKFKRMASPEEN